MRSLLYTILALLMLPYLGACTPLQGKRLSAEELAEGWVLLFDGQTAADWKIEGEHQIVDGTLTVGGTEAAHAYPRMKLGDGFRLQFSYRWEGPQTDATRLKTGFAHRTEITSHRMLAC